MQGGERVRGDLGLRSLQSLEEGTTCRRWGAHERDVGGERQFEVHERRGEADAVIPKPAVAAVDAVARAPARAPRDHKFISRMWRCFVVPPRSLPSRVGPPRSTAGRPGRAASTARRSHRPSASAKRLYRVERVFMGCHAHDDVAARAAGAACRLAALRLRFVTSQATAPRPPLPPRALNRKRSQKAFASTESNRRIGARKVRARRGATRRERKLACLGVLGAIRARRLHATRRGQWDVENWRIALLGVSARAGCSRERQSPISTPSSTTATSTKPAL